MFNFPVIDFPATSRFHSYKTFNVLKAFDNPTDLSNYCPRLLLKALFSEDVSSEIEKKGTLFFSFILVNKKSLSGIGNSFFFFFFEKPAPEQKNRGKEKEEAKKEECIVMEK